jgi:hypothetical protein
MGCVGFYGGRVNTTVKDRLLLLKGLDGSDAVAAAWEVSRRDWRGEARR